MVHGFGPIQLVVVGFDSAAGFDGDIRRELARASALGAVRVVDVLYMVKDADGTTRTETVDADVPAPDRHAVGTLVRRLLSDWSDSTAPGGAGRAAGPADWPAGSPAELLAQQPAGVPPDLATEPPGAESSLPARAIACEGGGPGTSGGGVGLTAAQVRAVADGLQPGTALCILLLELAWARGLAEAMQTAGAELLLQGWLTADAQLALGVLMDEDGSGTADDEARTLAGERASAVGEAVQVLVGRGFLRPDRAAPALAALLDAGVLDEASAREIVEATRTIGR